MVKCNNCKKKIEGVSALIDCKEYCQKCYYELRKSRRPQPQHLCRYSYRLENSPENYL